MLYVFLGVKTSSGADETGADHRGADAAGDPEAFSVPGSTSKNKS
jgi:hypothetical protein